MIKSLSALGSEQIGLVCEFHEKCVNFHNESTINSKIQGPANYRVLQGKKYTTFHYSFPKNIRQTFSLDTLGFGVQKLNVNYCSLNTYDEQMRISVYTY